jgi:hypothetical protein
MADINLDELGPVDYLVVSFPAERANFSGEMATALKELIDRNTIRLLDLVIVTKASDGTVEAAEVRDLDDSAAGQLRGLERDLALLLGAEDAEDVGASLEPGSVAAVLVWRRARHERPHPDPGAHRRHRSRPPGGGTRSVGWRAVRCDE